MLQALSTFKIFNAQKTSLENTSIGGSLMHISKIGTYLKVSDIKKSREFYGALGFTVRYEFGPDIEDGESSETNTYSGTLYTTDDRIAFLEIGDGHLTVDPKVFEEKITSSKVSLIVRVDSIKEILELADKAGISPEKDVVNYPWGVTEVVYKDPDGFHVLFNTPTKEEHKKKYPSIERD